MPRKLRGRRAVADAGVAYAAPPEPALAESLRRAVAAGRDPFRAALMTRSLHAIADVASSLDDATVGSLLASTDDPLLLVRMLEEAATQGRFTSADPFAAARLRGVRGRQIILEAEGGTWTAQQVADHLGITRQSVDRKRQAGRLLALPVGQHRYVFPVWQFDGHSVIEGLDVVLANFGLPGDWGHAAFFINHNDWLGGARPLDELRAGRIEDVRGAAAMMGEQAASRATSSGRIRRPAT